MNARNNLWHRSGVPNKNAVHELTNPVHLAQIRQLTRLAIYCYEYSEANIH